MKKKTMQEMNEQYKDCPTDVNIYEILSEHKDCFAGFGGHKMAAGFSFDKTKYSFEQIKISRLLISR